MHILCFLKNTGVQDKFKIICKEKIKYAVTLLGLSGEKIIINKETNNKKYKTVHTGAKTHAGGWIDGFLSFLKNSLFLSSLIANILTFYIEYFIRHKRSININVFCAKFII